MATGAPTCVVCGNELEADDRLVLAVGRWRRLPHCSPRCLRETVRKRRWRAAVGLCVLAVALAGLWTVRRHRKPPQQSITLAWSETGWKVTAPRGPAFYGPAWPPTDDDWAFAFGRVSWTYPLPGPLRRLPAASDQLYVQEPVKNQPAKKQAAKNEPAPTCRRSGFCGAMLGGELWGEHVYAVQDGVIDRARGGGSDEHGGGYVRIAHFGGMVFTHYFHLAAIPKGVSRGARVAAGDVIGLVGDTGSRGEGPAPRPHLHFAFSIRPSAEIGESFWDPVPLIARWPMRVPPHGTVAGLATPVHDEDQVRRRRGR